MQRSGSCGEWELDQQLASLDQLDRNLVDMIRAAKRQAISQLARPISQWAEAEIRIPTGQYAGSAYRHARHPISRIWFNELDRNYWWRHAVVAPTQNGKTFMGYVIPVLYHLFELSETVIVGLPDMRMADDKWQVA